MNDIHILSHADSDGRFAAYCAFTHCAERGLSDKLKMHEVQYGQPVPINIAELTKLDAVYILDFSYSREILESINEKVGVLVVLDHHKTAEAHLLGLPYAHFDMTKSGALLAWEYFFPDEEPPMPCLYVNDRDLWQWKYGKDTAAFEAYLRLNQVNCNWEEWHKLCNDPTHLIQSLDIGHQVLAYEQMVVRKFVNNPDNIRTIEYSPLGKPLNVVLYEGMGILTSELASVIYKDGNVDLTMEYRVRGDVMTFSLRSPRVDVSEIASHFGGGGHAAAAGFHLPVTDGFKFVSELFAKSRTPEVTTA